MSTLARTQEVVVDASLVAMWVLPEPLTASALALATDWARVNVQAIAPCFMLAEVTSAIYKRVRRGELDLPSADEALDIVLGFGVRLTEEPDLHRRALGLAYHNDRPSPYDAHYLALAERHHCELWTGDERLYNAVRQRIPWIRWIGSYSPASSER